MVTNNRKRSQAQTLSFQGQPLTLRSQTISLRGMYLVRVFSFASLVSEKLIGGLCSETGVKLLLLCPILMKHSGVFGIGPHIAIIKNYAYLNLTQELGPQLNSKGNN